MNIFLTTMFLQPASARDPLPLVSGVFTNRRVFRVRPGRPSLMDARLLACGARCLTTADGQRAHSSVGQLDTTLGPHAP